MKRIKLFNKPIALFLLLGFLTLLGQSCKKYLQVQPRDYMFEEEAFATQQGVQSVLNGIYQSMADSVLYGNALTLNVTELLAQYFGTQEKGSEFSQYMYNYPEGKAMINNIWKQSYRTILSINKFCRKLEDANYNVLTSADRNILLGEAYALRAFLHFDQLRMFGPVYAIKPDAISTPYVRIPDLEVQPILKASTVMDEVLLDLEAALKLLDNDPVRKNGVNRVATPPPGASIDYMSNRHFRMNYFAVKAITARVQLYAGKKEEAWKTVQSVMLEQEAFFPWPSITDMGSDPLLSKEAYFGIENRRLYDYNRQLFSALLNDMEIYAPSQEKLESIYNTSSKDLRLSTWFKVGIEGDKYYKVLVKFSSASITDAAIRYYQPLIRKSELYLIAAETAPDLEQGYFYLNSLRINKGLAPISYSAASNSFELLNAIQAEYQSEFIGEGQTFFMFKRCNLAEIVGWDSNSVYLSYDNYVWPHPTDESYYR